MRTEKQQELKDLRDRTIGGIVGLLLGALAIFGMAQLKTSEPWVGGEPYNHEIHAQGAGSEQPDKTRGEENNKILSFYRNPIR